MTNSDPERLEVLPTETTLSPCRHLRSKGMYVYTDSDPGLSHDDYDCTAYWCLKSMTNFGPDDDRVGRPECENPSRSCHQSI